MNITKVKLTTPIAHFPLVINNNFDSVKRYLDIFYDEDDGVIVSPINTTGRIKAAKGEFATMIADNVVVRSQFTNILQNVTTVDNDYYNTYTRPPIEPRDASVDELPGYDYVDVNRAYYKITNDVSIAFKTDEMGKQIELMLEDSTSEDFHILIDPSEGTIIEVDNLHAPKTTFTLIAVHFDPSLGTTWALRHSSGNFNII